jgi:hypothetical protein
MSTKLNAEELAAKHHTYYARREAYAAAIREVAQPIADQRDELLEALTDLHDTAIDARALVAGQQTPIDRAALIILLTERLANARAAIAKCTPKP